jgi:hypothetical protein
VRITLVLSIDDIIAPLLSNLNIRQVDLLHIRLPIQRWTCLWNGTKFQRQRRRTDTLYTDSGSYPIRDTSRYDWVLSTIYTGLPAQASRDYAPRRCATTSLTGPKLNELARELLFPRRIPDEVQFSREPRTCSWPSARVTLSRPQL